MGVFDSLAETTKFIGKEAERLIQEARAKPLPGAIPGAESLPSSAYIPTAPRPPITAPATAPATMQAAPTIQPDRSKFVEVAEKEQQPLAGTAMDRFRAVEHAPPIKDFEPIDPNTVDPGIFKVEGTKFIEMNGFGSVTGLSDEEIAAVGGMVINELNMQAFDRWYYTNYPDEYNATQAAKLSKRSERLGISDADYVTFHEREATGALMPDGHKWTLEAIAKERAEQELVASPVLNTQNALAAGIAQVKALHPDDFAVWASTTEGYQEIMKYAYEAYMIPPEKAPPSLVERAAGVVLRGVTWAEETLLDLPIAGAIATGQQGMGPIGLTPGRGLSLRDIREGAHDVTQTAFGDSPIGRALMTAETFATSPTNWVLTLALTPGSLAARAAFLGATSVGAGVGGEAAVQAGAPRWAGEMVGMGVGGISALKAFAYMSPTKAMRVSLWDSKTGMYNTLKGKTPMDYAGLSAARPGMSEALVTQENLKLVAKLEAQGLKAKLVRGWFPDENGVLVPEQSVLVEKMSATQAVREAAALNQDSVMLKDGIYVIAEKKLYPYDLNKLRVGTDLEGAKTRVTLETGEEIDFAHEVLWDKGIDVDLSVNPLTESPATAWDLLPKEGRRAYLTQIGLSKNDAKVFAGRAFDKLPTSAQKQISAIFEQGSIPLEAPAAAEGRLTTAGTFRVDGGKTPMVREPIDHFTVWSRQRLNGDVEIGFSTGTGTAADFRAERDSIGRLLREAVEDNPGKRVIAESFDPAEAEKFKGLLNGAGLDIDENGVVTRAAGGGAGTPGAVPGGAAPGRPAVPIHHPESPDAIRAGVSWPFFARQVYRRIYQVTGKVPILNRLHIPMNPQALLNEPIAKDLASWNGWLDYAAATNKINLARLYAEPRSRWMSGVISRPVSEVKLTAAAKATAKARKTWWVENGKTYATQNDIMSFGSKYFEMSADDTAFVELNWQTVESYVEHLEAMGVPIRHLMVYEEGWHWMPRGPQLGKNGIESFKLDLGAGRGVGGKGSFMQHRVYEYQAEALANGVDLNADFFDIVSTTMNAMRHMEADAHLTQIAQRYGVALSHFADPDLVLAKTAMKSYVEWDARWAKNLRAQMADLSKKVTFRSLRAKAGAVPDAWYSETVTKVDDILARYKAETMAAQVARRANPRVRVPGLSTAELNKIAKPYKAEIKALLDATALRKQQSVANVLKAKSEYEADMRNLRATMTAGPESRIKSNAFPGHENFPEDSFAIKTIPPSMWPKLTDVLFPRDIAERLAKQMSDNGNTVSAFLQKLNDIPRTLQTGADMNFPFIQGMPLLFRNPAAFGSAITKAYATVFTDPALGMRYMLSEADKHPEEFAAFLKWVRQMGEGEFFQSARVGGVVYKTPLLGKAYARGAQGFDTMLDIGRWEYWKGIYGKAKSDGDFESLGAMTRDLLGTTSTRGLGISMTQRQIEGGLIMFAPRYTRSAFGMLAWAMQPGVAGHEARRALFQMITGGSMLYYGACKALGQEPQFNPLESGFMSVRVGDNYLGMGGIFRSMLRSVAWSMDAARTDPSKFYDPSRVLDNPAFEFMRSRTSPLSGKLIDAVTGSDFIGRPTRSDWGDIANMVRRTVTPFGFDTILDSKGAMLPRMGAIVGEFFLGRSTPISVNQLRDEASYRWAQENNVVVHDVVTGEARPPKTYREFTDDQRVMFDQAEPSYSQDVRENAKATERAWSEMDDVYAETDRQLLSIETIYSDSTSPHYQDGTWYRQMRSTVLGNAYTLREQFYAKNPTAEKAPTTQEQKWAASYLEEVIVASVDKGTGEADFVLQEQLSRLWRTENGDEASALIDREYAASTSRLDSQFRADNVLLRPYFAFEDSMWSQDFFTDPNNPVSLPSLSNGQKALNFRTSSEYRAALRADILRVILEQGKIPDNLAGIPTSKGGDTLGERFPGKLSDTQARRASNVLATYFMQPFYNKQDGIITEFLKQNPKYMTPLLTWDYWTGSVATEEFLP